MSVAVPQSPEVLGEHLRRAHPGPTVAVDWHRLRQLRQRHGWTVADLADLASLDVRTVTRLESCTNARRWPHATWRTVEVLAELYGVPTLELLA